MKIDKQKLPIYISITLSLITFGAIFGFGAIALSIIYRIFFPVVFLLWISSFLLSLSWKELRGILSPNAINSAFIIYLGAIFISLSRFKTEIAEGSVDINMIGVGLALIAIALGLTAQFKENKEQVFEANNSTTILAPEVCQENDDTIDTQALMSIDVVLDEVRRRIDFQFEQIDGLVTKSGIALGIAGVIFTLLVTNILGQSDTIANLFLAKIALIPLLMSLSLSFIPIFIMKWDRPPDLNRLRDYYIVKDIGITKLNIIDKCLEAIDNNKKLIDKLFRLIKYSYVLLFFGFTLLAVWIGINVW
ncbi:MAG: hypothetical protein ACRKGH_09170 [Dehalogenimonas sp.]|uniref:Uncharacterized protein n=1 Tax=Candidatus Dehalogenimonas loeffleri TaxID=3127115 RepID=A0ABZ2J5H1_9CHLR|nr:hypothetical protein [Dehalogenimonas sp.]